MARNTTPPPDDRARVDLFLATVEQYEQFSAAFPLPSQLTFSSEHPMTAPEEHWQRIMHGAILRKYIQHGDDVFLPTVINSVMKITDITRPEVRNTWQALKKSAHGIKRPRQIGFNLNGKDIAGHELALDVLYGTLLHGDWERWQRACLHGGFSDMVMFDWIGDLWQVVFNVRGCWDLAVQEGLVKELQDA